jgi:hypothetical protein
MHCAGQRPQQILANKSPNGSIFNVALDTCHCGVLIPARHPVSSFSIGPAAGMVAIDYYHIEFDTMK